MNRKTLYTDDDYLSFFDDGTIGISDGVGYIGYLTSCQVVELYLEMKKFIESDIVKPNCSCSVCANR